MTTKSALTLASPEEIVALTRTRPFPQYRIAKTVRARSIIAALNTPLSSDECLIVMNAVRLRNLRSAIPAVAAILEDTVFPTVAGDAADLLGQLAVGAPQRLRDLAARAATSRLLGWTHPDSEWDPAFINILDTAIELRGTEILVLAAAKVSMLGPEGRLVLLRRSNISPALARIEPS